MCSWTSSTTIRPGLAARTEINYCSDNVRPQCALHSTDVLIRCVINNDKDNVFLLFFLINNKVASIWFSFVFLFLLMLLLGTSTLSSYAKAEDRLLNYLFRNYQKWVRPVEFLNGTVRVKFGLAISQLVDVVSLIQSE